MNPTRSNALLAALSVAIMAALVPASISHATPFSIHWTAPGDDSLTGRATLYDLRYSSSPITTANFTLATKILGLPQPAAPGTLESFVVSGLPDGVLIYMAIKTADEAANWSRISNVATRPAQTTGVDVSTLELSFSSSWPNPARESVRWAFSLPQAAPVQVDVFDVTGRHVHTVVSGQHEAGRGEWSWDLRDDWGHRVGAGVYLVRARLGAKDWTKRLIVIR